MNRKTLLIILACGLTFAMGFTLAARMTSTNGEVIPRDVVAAGGGQSRGSGFALSATIGQPIAGASANADGYTLVGGFQTMTPRRPAAVRNWALY